MSVNTQKGGEGSPPFLFKAFASLRRLSIANFLVGIPGTHRQRLNAELSSARRELAYPALCSAARRWKISIYTLTSEIAAGVMPGIREA
jgi:hypothetical protein